MRRFRLPVLFLPLLFVAATVAATQTPSTAVSVQTVREQTLTETATAYGQLVPNPQALRWLSAALAGRVDAVYATVGATVRAGQKLVFVKPTPQTLATFQDAQSSLVSEHAKLRQTETLEHNGLATKAQLAAAKSALATARSRLAALRGEGVSSHGEILKAVRTGVVTQLVVAPGQWVNAGAQIAALVPAGALWVRLGLPPKVAARVKPGAKAKLSPVFGAGKPFAGKVARIAGQANPKTGLVDADVPVSAVGSGFFPGEWVTGTITLRRRKLPAVPRTAVLKDQQGYYVFAVRDGKAHRVAVEPRVRAHGLVGLRGVKPGATVVTQGNFELTNGAAVRIAKTGNAGP